MSSRLGWECHIGEPLAIAKENVEKKQSKKPRTSGGSSTTKKTTTATAAATVATTTTTTTTTTTRTRLSTTSWFEYVHGIDVNIIISIYKVLQPSKHSRPSASKIFHGFFYNCNRLMKLDVLVRCSEKVQ